MLFEVPEVFLSHPSILKLKNLTMLHYFNREESQAIQVKINQHLLLHIFHGSKVIQKEEQEYRVNAKESLFVSRGQYVMSEILSFENASFDGIMIFFDDTFLLMFFSKYSEIFTQTQEETLQSKENLILVQEESSLHNTMVSINAYVKQKSSEVLLQLKFEEILLQALENDKSKSLYNYLTNLYTTGLLNFKNIFEKEEFLDVESMIKASKLSEDKFRKLFFELYALTPKEWLINRALHKAKQLLQEGKLNVSEVSLLCNFNSLSWFIKQFKAKFGMTPKQFQQNH